MKKNFEVKTVDEKFYEEKIRNFLPGRIIDVHTHIWLKGRGCNSAVRDGVVTWPSRVAEENSAEDLMDSYKLLFPGKEVIPLLFNSPIVSKNLDILNRYVIQSAEKYKLPSLMLCRPDWTAEKFSERLEEGNFLGVKPYLNFAPADIPGDKVCIFDFMPRHQLEALNRTGKILLLHIPRPGRLKDKVNLAQMLEIERRYPEIKLIIAHVGRAYCPEDIGDAFSVLKDTKMFFDISANTNEKVFLQLIEAVGPGRILFGSDMPITRMRMRRICENGIYINFVPSGMYGDVSGDKNMREVSGAEAEELSFFLYEEIYAFLTAAGKTGLGKNEIERVFYSNAAELLKSAGFTEVI
ncbi:MAG: amidohydrolase family protein [Candidatus Omnitrophica bacterium]|nr:amidohydrolase family protein [Candidatus Omnitrophota bacterium]